MEREGGRDVLLCLMLKKRKGERFAIKILRLHLHFPILAGRRPAAPSGRAASAWRALEALVDRAKAVAAEEEEANQ